MAPARPERPPPLEPVTLGKTSRDKIFKASIATGSVTYNKWIRRALGFRETNTGIKGKPIFASPMVSELNAELDRIAAGDLANHSLEDMNRSWTQKRFTHRIEHLVRDVGQRIWGDPIEKRISSNPSSSLTSANEEGTFKDLLYSNDQHREFITLQLEHLVVLKAKAHFRNQANKFRKSEAVATDSDGFTPTKPRKAGTKSSELCRVDYITDPETCIVTIRVNPKKLQKVLEKCSEESQELQNGIDETSEQPENRKRTRATARRSSARQADATDSDEDYVPRKKRVSRRDFSEHGRSVTIGNNGVAEQDPDEGFVNDETRAVTAAGEGEAVAADEVTDEDAAVEEEVAVIQEGGAVQEPLSDAKVQMMRDDLAMLFYGEFCLDSEISHTKLPTTAAMLEKSRKLDELLCDLWARGKPDFEICLQDKYATVEEGLQTWLAWRDSCWRLADVSGIHPFGNVPIVRLPYEQWEGLLGGQEQYQKLDQRLITTRQKLAASGFRNETSEFMAELLGWAFAATADDPNFTLAIRKDLVSYNKRLFSWSLRMWAP